jgi:hypothetical protein
MDRLYGMDDFHPNSDRCQHRSVDEAEGTLHVETPKSARKVMQIHFVGI